MLRFTLLLLAGLALSLSAADDAKPAEAAPASLAGMKFAITLVSADGQDKNEDVLIFDGNKDEGALFGVKPASKPPGRATLMRAGHNAGDVQIATLEPEGEGQ